MANSAITGPILSDNKRAPAGTAAAPSFAFNDSTGTGVYLVSAGVLGLSTAGVQRVVVDASGNVGIGTGSPTNKLQVSGSGSTYMAVNSINAGSGAGLYMTNSTNSYLIGAGAASGGSGLEFRDVTNSTTRMTLDASGNLLVNKSSGNDGTFHVRSLTTGARAIGAECLVTSNFEIISFRNPNGIVGTINTNGSNTAFLTSSDYRLKEDVKPMTAALSKVAALKPVTYKWKADGSEGEGFIAHELAEVCPIAVSGEKDAVNEDGSIKAQGIDPSKLVGLLTAAIQELSAKNEELEARLAALESK